MDHRFARTHDQYARDSAWDEGVLRNDRDFTLLRLWFRPETVRVEERVLDGLVLLPVSEAPFDDHLGACFRHDGPCPFDLVAERVHDSVEQVLAHKLSTRQVTALGQPGVPVVLRALDRYVVHRVLSRGPIRVASLVGNPMLDNIPITLEILRQSGWGRAARHSNQWEIIRIVRETLHVAAIEVPLNSPDHVGSDLAVFAADRDLLTINDLGTVGEHRGSPPPDRDVPLSR